MSYINSECNNFPYLNLSQPMILKVKHAPSRKNKRLYAEKRTTWIITIIFLKLILRIAMEDSSHICSSITLAQYEVTSYGYNKVTLTAVLKTMISYRHILHSFKWNPYKPDIWQVLSLDRNPYKPRIWPFLPIISHKTSCHSCLFLLFITRANSHDSRVVSQNPTRCFWHVVKYGFCLIPF